MIKWKWCLDDYIPAYHTVDEADAAFAFGSNHASVVYDKSDLDCYVWRLTCYALGFGGFEICSSLYSPEQALKIAEEVMELEAKKMIESLKYFIEGEK